MKSSGVLLIRSIISKLHPPASVTPRESQQLLRMLDGAFRKQLDEAHPAPYAQHDAEQTDGPIHGHRSANSYLDSLLHHPMMGTKNTSNTSQSQIGGNTRAVDLLESFLRDGRLTSVSLERCAANYLVERKAQKSAVSPLPEMTPMLAAWFDSASLDQQAELYQNSRTIELVLQVSYVEKAEEMVWAWLKTLYETEWRNTSLSKRAQLHAEDLCVSTLMRFAIKSGSPSSAVQQYLTANRYSAANRYVGGQPHLTMTNSWKRLTSYILHMRRTHGIDTDSYTSLLDFAQSHEHKTILTPGFIAVYHPASPSATPLYEEYQDTSFVGRWVAWKARKPARLQRALLTTILDAAELSLKQNCRNEAVFFIEFAQAHFADIVSKTDTNQAPIARLEHAREELDGRSISAFQLNTSWVHLRAAPG